MDATIVFLEQRGNRINLLVRFTKHRQLARQVGDCRALSIVEQEAMAPRTVGGLAGGMAHGCHIRRENYEFTDVKEPAPASTYYHDPNLRHGYLSPVARGGHTLGTAPDGSIPRFTYVGGSVPSLVTGHGQVFHLGNRRSVAHDELAQRMASTDHIPLGNHEVIHTNGLAPITSFYPV